MDYFFWPVCLFAARRTLTRCDFVEVLLIVFVDLHFFGGTGNAAEKVSENVLPLLTSMFCIFNNFIYRIQ